MTLYVVRAVWLSSQLLALLALPSTRSPLRFFSLHLTFSLLLSVVYFPELIPHWMDAFWPLVLAVLLSRTLAVIESVHLQTTERGREFPYWSRLIAGAFLFSFIPVLIIWVTPTGSNSKLLIEWRRYLQLWTGMAIGLVEMELWAVGRLSWWRPRDRHALLLAALSLNHMTLSVVGLVIEGEERRSGLSSPWWHLLDLAGFSIDSLVYLGWVWCFRAGMPTPAPLSSPPPARSSRSLPPPPPATA